MKQITAIFTLLLLLTISTTSMKAQTPSKEKELVIAQMNCCINSLTKIVQCNSIQVLDHETDLLLNNLTMTEIVGLEEVAKFRAEMIQRIGDLRITSQERRMMKRINLKRKNQMIWTAMGNSLDGFSFLLPFSRGIPKGKGAAIQTAIIGTLTAARSAIEYQRLSAEGEIEEMQQLWELRKADLSTFAALQKEALELEFKLYQRFKLNEYDRLTETTASRFNEIIWTKDPETRIRRLKDNKHVYTSIADYYYYLGMAYIDLQDYKSAKPYFDKYEQMYQMAPIYRHNEKLGCIALAQLAYDKSLDLPYKERLMKTALDNLPDNGAAVLQVAYIYINDLGDNEKAFNILRSGIDNTAISDRDIIIDTAITLMDEIKKYPKIHKSIQKAIEDSEDIRLSSYINYIIKSDNAGKWEQISNCILLDPTEPAKDKLTSQVFNCIGATNDSYFLCKDNQSAETLSKSVENNDELFIHVNDRFVCLPEDLEIYHLTQDKSNMKIVKYTQAAYGAIKRKDIYNNLEFLQHFPTVFNYLFEPADNSGNYRVNSHIDYGRLQEGNYNMLHPEIQRIFEFSLTENERKDLAEFCKKQIATTGMNPVIISKDNTGYFADKKTSIPYREAVLFRDTVVKSLPLPDNTVKNEPYCKIEFYGDSLAITPEAWYGKHAEHIVLKVKGMKPMTLTLDFSNKECRLFSVEYDGAVNYNNFAVAHVKDFMIERNKITAAQNDTLTWMDKMKRKWDSLWEKDDAKDKKQKEETKNESHKVWYEFWK